MHPPQPSDVSIRQLVEVAKDRKIPRILLTDYATIEPVRENGAIVMVPMLRVVATLFDRGGNLIYRWSEQKPSKRMVTILAGAGRGPNSEPALASRKEEVRQVLRDEGFEVDEGEWTPDSARAFLEARHRLIG